MSDTVIESCFKINLSDEHLYADFQRASHVLLFAKTEKLSVINRPRKATVLMQMRFDGHIGFPGGLVDEGESPVPAQHFYTDSIFDIVVRVEAVNRECWEEIGWRGNVTQENLLFIHANKSHGVIRPCLLTYFFGKELTEEALSNVIKNSVDSRDFGYESYGPVIVPLYTMPDSFRGFPAYLTNNFIGNAKTQLTNGLIALGILSEDEVKTALEAKDPRCT